METKPALPIPLVGFSNRIASALVTNDENKYIHSSTDVEIKMPIRYGIAMLGISEDKHGDELSKAVMINHLRLAYGSVTLKEIRLAFELALEKKTTPNIELYKGEYISAKFVGGIIAEYLAFKKKIIPKNTEGQMNNIQRVTAILNLLPQELKDGLGNVGKEKDKPRERIKMPYEDMHQKWMKQFDKLYRNQDQPPTDEHGKELPGRWIERYGGKMNIDMFFQKKLDQLKLASERQKDLL